MSLRLKYSLNGIYRCENFAQHLANNDFPTVPIGSVGGFDDWFINLKTDSLNATLIYPWIYSPNSDTELRIKSIFCVHRKDGSIFRTNSRHLEIHHGPRGLNMDIFALTMEENGYLYNGALMIEYGFQVESILGKDNIWRFNTWDPLFESEEKKNMIQINNPKNINYPNFYVHKQLFTFHSPYFKSRCDEDKGNLIEIISYSNDDLENFLQICQGVHIDHLNVENLARSMHFASRYSMRNVMCYCERQLIENDLKLDYLEGFNWHHSRHFLKHFLKSVKSPRETIDEDDIGKMKGEAMKIFVAKFLYNKF